MGLLDFYDDPQANLALAAGLLSGGNFGQAMGRGLAGAQAVQIAAQEKRLREAQANEYAMRAERAKQEQAQQMAASERDAMFQKALQQGVPPAQLAQYFPEKVDLLKKLADAPNFGRQAVARTVEVEGPNGTKMLRQLGQYGDQLTEDMQGYVAPQGVNLGNKYIFTKPAAGQSFDIGMSPSERDASARGWASNAIAQQRLAMDKDNDPNSKPAWNADLGGFVDPRSRVVLPALDAQGKEIKTPGAKLTESESKSTLYLSQMRDATKALQSIGSDVSPVMVAATGNPWTNWAAGENSQKAAQAQRQWAEAYLREKTGAAATAGEVENNIRTFFPVVGDSDAVIKQKADARAKAEAAMQIPAGRGAARLNESAPVNVGAIPPKAIAELKMRGPSAKAQFDAAFGAGAADAVLRGQ